MSTDAAIDAVEEAARVEDEAALAKALKALGGGYRWRFLEKRAHECAQRGEYDLAFRLYRAVCEGPASSALAWNNVCHALSAAKSKDIPGQRELLERALTIAPMNVPTFHNVACAALRLGLDELALEAVEGAARFGYEKLADLRSDADLTRIAADPRFANAFARTYGWRPDDIAKLALTLTLNGQPHVVHRAVLGMTFYLSGRIAEMMARVAPVFDAYLADVPLGTMAFYRRGLFKPFTKAMMTKERKMLAALPAVREFHRLHLRPTDGDACEYELLIEASDEDRVATMSLAFPATDANDPDALEERFVRYAELMRAHAGHAGYSYTNRQNDAYEGIDWSGSDLADRFLGFQRADSWWSAGCAPPAHWLVWLPKRPENVGDAQVKETPAGASVRCAKLPPVAPRGRPDDVGALPDVSRALAARRIQPNGEKNVGYLARWDEVKSTAWENAPEGWAPRVSKAPEREAATPKKKSAKKKSFFAK